MGYENMSDDPKELRRFAVSLDRRIEELEKRVTDLKHERELVLEKLKKMGQE